MGVKGRPRDHEVQYIFDLYYVSEKMGNLKITNVHTNVPGRFGSPECMV